MKEIGGARRDRTADLYTASVALSQLSYGPSSVKEGAFYELGTIVSSTYAPVIKRFI